jgi:hypothetical protein
MRTVDIQPIADALAKEFEDMVRLVMDSEAGINHKVGVNTLSGSNIYRDLMSSGMLSSDGLVVSVLLNDYIFYIEHGRRKGAKMPPVEPIIRWARSRGISTDNSTIFLIRRAISRDGIKGRPIMEKVLELMDTEMVEEGGWLDRVFDEIIKTVDEFFNS